MSAASSSDDDFVPGTELLLEADDAAGGSPAAKKGAQKRVLARKPAAKPVPRKRAKMQVKSVARARPRHALPR